MRQPPGPDDPTTVGRFRIVCLLGAGGMGRVLLGEDPDGRLAAIKLVHPELADDGGFHARFRREIRLAAQAPPGWTAPFLDADPDAPRPWLATAYLDAPSLLEYLTAGGSLAPAAAADLGASPATAFRTVVLPLTLPGAAAGADPAGRLGEVTGPVSRARPSPPVWRHPGSRPCRSDRNAAQELGRPRCCTAWERNGS